ncbi:MAG TPA: ATP-binding protein [Oligoflexia bacterium]|nr:ATP-binding protein [Oligoflexia bacterium]HMP48131.1 ATP-binding protein [Oligoflexia bacterium]
MPNLIQPPNITREFVSKVRRHISISFPLLQVVLGPRQVGKTYGIKQLLESWPGPKIMETADLITPPDARWIENHWRRALSLGNNTLLVLDEIQKIPAWSEAIKLLFDESRNKIDLKVVLLGSASLSLQEGLTESLAGRFELTKVPHWDFNESREIVKISPEEYICYGGYPESYRYINDFERWQNFMMYSILEPVISRDIQASRRINKPALFKQTLELVMRNPAQEISFQKMLGQLQENGNVTTIQHYLNLLEGAFLIKQLRKYSPNQLKQKVSSPKLIPSCSGLSNAFLGIKVDQKDEHFGRLFESAIGALLASLDGELYYWREGDYEVDFILQQKKKTYAIEVKSGKRKNSASLGKFLKKYPYVTPVIINKENFPALLEKKKEFFSELNPH